MSGHCHWCDSQLGPKERAKLEERCRDTKPAAPVEVVERLAEALGEAGALTLPDETLDTIRAALAEAAPYRKKG